MSCANGPEVPSRRDKGGGERMDGQRCILWVFLVKMQGEFSVNLFEKRGEWAMDF